MVKAGDYIGDICFHKYKEARMVSELSSLIHNLVLDNPVPAKDLAKAIGKPYSTLLREVNPYDAGAKLGAETLLQIMIQTGDTKPLEYMAGKLGYTLTASKGEARRLIQQGGVSVDGEKVASIDLVITREQLTAGVKIKKGKKVFHKAVIK